MYAPKSFVSVSSISYATRDQFAMIDIHTGILVTRSLLHKNIHLTLTLKSLCMIRLKGGGEVLINNRHLTFPSTYGSLAIS